MLFSGRRDSSVLLKSTRPEDAYIGKAKHEAEADKRRKETVPGQGGAAALVVFRRCFLCTLPLQLYLDASSSRLPRSCSRASTQDDSKKKSAQTAKEGTREGDSEPIAARVLCT